MMDSTVESEGNQLYENVITVEEKTESEDVHGINSSGKDTAGDTCGHCYRNCSSAKDTKNCTINDTINVIIAREQEKVENASGPAKISKLISVNQESIKKPNLYFMAFDLETNGPWPRSEILQIATVSSHGTFERFIMPMSKITETTTKINGFEKETKEDGTTSILKRNGAQVETVTKKSALIDFIDFLERERDRYDPEAIFVLISHNSNNCDARKLIENMQGSSFRDRPILNRLMFGNSMTLAKTFRVSHETNLHHFYYGLKKVFAVFYPGEEFEAHNAIGDSEAVFKIVTAMFLEYPFEEVVEALDLKTFEEVEEGIF